MFVILSWLDHSDIGLVLNQDGKVRLFESHAETESFAESELTDWNIEL